MSFNHQHFVKHLTSLSAAIIALVSTNAIIAAESVSTRT